MPRSTCHMDRRGCYRYLILHPLQLELLFPNEDNTRRPRTGLGPSYRNSLVERCFWKKYKPSRNPKSAYTTMSLRMHPYPHAYAATSMLTQLGFQEFYKESFLLKIVVKPIPHCLELPPPFVSDRDPARQFFSQTRLNPHERVGSWSSKCRIH